MVLAAPCLLLGGAHIAALAPSCVSSSSSSSSAATRPRLMRILASSSSPSPAPYESASAASVNLRTLEMPPAPPATSTLLVSRTPHILTPEGIAGAGFPSIHQEAGLAKVNHYDILRVPYGSSTFQIAQAFKARVEEVTSQENEGDDDTSREQLRKLQVSFEILTTEEDRRMYDWVLQHYLSRSQDTYIWPYETDITQKYTNKEEPPVMRSFDEEGNNKVGLFLLGWLILSFILSVMMKTWTPYPHYSKF